MIVVAWIGVILIFFGTLKTMFVREFHNRLHTMGVSDTVGTFLMIFGMMGSGFEIPKLILFLIFVLVWNPLITHTLAKAYIERLKR